MDGLQQANYDPNRDPDPDRGCADAWGHCRLAVSLILAVLAMLFGNNCGGKVEVVEVEVEQSFILAEAAKLFTWNRHFLIWMSIIQILPLLLLT